MIDQVTVFLENSKGRLASLCKALGDAGISMHALTVADTHDFGVARIITDDPARAAETLNAAGYRAKLTKVCAVRVPDTPGGLAPLLEAFDEANANVEYAYCFGNIGSDEAIDVFRVDDEQAADTILVKAGYKQLQASDLYK
jgi:hypothetical protein